MERRDRDGGNRWAGGQHEYSLEFMLQCKDANREEVGVQEGETCNDRIKQ